MLGARVLETPSRPLLVLASAYSLVSIYVIGGDGLMWGVMLDLALFLIGVSGIYLRLPRAAAMGSAQHAHA
jgi:hypothetical protein